jgi:adenylate cyclase
MQLRRIAEEKQVTELHVIAHYTLGYAALCMGNLGDARGNFGEGIAQYQPSQRSAETYRAAQDPGVACRGYLAMTEWLLGFPERAQIRMRESLELAEELGDRFSLAYALCFPGAIVSETCGGDTGAIVERGLEVATAGGFSLWIAFGKVHRASLHYKEHQSESALGELRESVVAIPQMGVHTMTSYYTALLARAYRQAGRNGEGLQALDDAQATIDARGECWWEAEIQRLRGEILLSQSGESVGDAEACFERSLDISRGQEAKSLELRAATSLARLWRRQDKGDEARRLLGECYAWFTEGFETADLTEAKALLDELK